MTKKCPIDRTLESPFWAKFIMAEVDQHFVFPKTIQGVPQKPGPRFELRFFRMKSLFLSAYLFLPKKEFIIVNENIQHYIRSVIIRKDGRMFKHEV